MLRCPAPTRLIRILPSWKVREEFNQLLCLGFSTNVFYAFDTIRSPCSISFEPLRSSIFRLRLKQFPELFYSQNSRGGWDKSPSLSIIFGLSSKTQWLSGLYYADFISFYNPTQLCGGGTTKSNSNEFSISVPLSLFSRRKVSESIWMNLR